MTPEELRAEFPVTESVAYLNAGTCGPVPRAAVDAMRDAFGFGAQQGRTMPYFERMIETQGRLRAAYAGVVGAAPEDIALTTATSDGMVRVLLGLELAPFDEILTAEREHPGLLGPLTALRDRLGISIREVPLAEIADAVTDRTRLVACSHVAWTTGELAPDLSHLDIPVLLDGAQGAGAIPIDVAALGCAFYAAAGQKWLCGPVGTGLLYVSPAWQERVSAAGPTYMNLGDPSTGLGAQPWPDARAHDSAALSYETAAAALAAHDTLAAFGWENVYERARAQAASLATRLAAAGREVAPRGDTTLVSWVSDDAEAEVARYREAGIAARGFAGLPWVRASVGAWNDDSDLDRLLAVA